MRRKILKPRITATASARITAAAGAVCVLIGAFLFAGPANAATVSGAASSTAYSPHVTVVSVPMTLDCTASTAARRYCNVHGVTPYNLVAGDCGDSYVYIYDDGGGVARFEYGYHSSMGSVVNHSLQVSWVNWNSGAGQYFSDNNRINGPAYGNTAFQNTGAGYVTTTMAGSVTLASGGTCTILFPSDATTIA